MRSIAVSPLHLADITEITRALQRIIRNLTGPCRSSL
jgi:hypothetical protein